jgi:adenylate cyclase
MSVKPLGPFELKQGHWLSAYARVFEGDVTGALNEAKQAVALAPYEAFLIGDCSQFQAYAGHYDEAIAWADLAFSRDPSSQAFYAMNKGLAQTAAGRYEQSRESLREAGDGYLPVLMLRMINAVRLGLPDEAKAEAQKAAAIKPEITASYWRYISFSNDPKIIHRQIADLVSAGLPADQR